MSFTVLINSIHRGGFHAKLIISPKWSNKKILKKIAGVTNMFFQFTFLENRSRGEIKIKTIKIFTFMKNRSKGEVKITNMPDIGQMLMIISCTTFLFKMKLSA